MNPSNASGQPQETDQILYAVDDVPPPWVSAGLSLQTILLILAPVMITPLVVFQAAGLPAEQASWMVFAALVASGITTVIQCRPVGSIGAGYLLFMGTSGAFLAAAIPAALAGGLPLLATLCLCASLFQFLFGRMLGLFRKIITPLVGGVIIMLVVVAVLPIVLDVFTGGATTVEGQRTHFWVGSATLLLIITLGLFLPSRLRMWSPVIGLVAGTLLAQPAGLTDWQAVSQAAWFGLPQSSWPGLDLSFSRDFWLLLPAFVIVTMVGAFETIGDAMAIQKVSHRKPRNIDYRAVQGAVYADGLGNALSGALGTIPNTTYSNLISVAELTGVAARRIGVISGVILVLLAFFPKLAAVVISLPQPVTGAFLFMLMAMLFVMGVKLAVSGGLTMESSILLGVPFWLGYALENDLFFADLIPPALEPFLGNGMVVGGTAAVLLSILYEMRPRRRLRLNLTSEADSLPALQRQLDGFARQCHLSERERYDLQLAAEEIFVHLYENRNEPGIVNVCAEVEPRRIQLEMIDRAQGVPAIDDPQAAGAQAVDVAPESIGLMLLARIARTVRHLEISGVHYISAELPREL